MATGAFNNFPLYERDKERLRGTAFQQEVPFEEEVEEKQEDLTPEEYDQLYRTLYPEEGTTPVEIHGVDLEPAETEQKVSGESAPEVEPTPDEYEELFQQEFQFASPEEQEELRALDTPDEHGITPREYQQIAEELDPKVGMEIRLPGLTVERVFESNPEWRESLIPGPDGLEYAWDVTKGIVEGVGNALIEVGNFMAPRLIGIKGAIDSDIIEDFSKNNIYLGELDFNLETAPGEVASDLSRFLTGYLTVSPNRFVPGLGTSNATYRYLVDNLIFGSMGDLIVANKDDQTVIGQLFPESDNPIIQALRIDPEDSELSAKAAIALEGSVFATALEGLFDFGRWSYRAWRGQPAKDALDVFFENSEDLFNPSHRYNLDLGEQAHRHTFQMDLEPKPTGQQMMDEMQRTLLGIDDQFDEIQKARELYRARNTELPFKERMKIRTETKNALNVAQKDLKKIEEQIKPITQNIDNLVRELQGMYDFAEGVGGIKGIVDEIPAEKAIEEASEAARKATKPGEVFEPLSRETPAGTLLPERPLVPEVGTNWIDRVTDLRNQIRRQEELLRQAMDNHKATYENITQKKYLLQEIADEVQLEAAIRKGHAIRLDMTPRYKAVDLADETPLVNKLTDEGLEKLRVQHGVTGKFTLLNTDGVKFSRVPKNTQRGASARMVGKAPTAEDTAAVGRTMETRPQPSSVNDALVEDIFYKQRGTSIPDKILNRVRGSYLGHNLWYRSTDKLRSLAEVSPTAGKLANLMRHDAVHMGPEAGQYGYTESVQFMVGQFRTRLRDALAQLDNSHKTYRGKLTEDANEKLWNWLNGVRKEELPADMLDVAREVRQILDDFHAQSPEVSAYIADFFPRQINKRVLARNEDEFRRLLAQDGYTDKIRQDEIIKHLNDQHDADLGIIARDPNAPRFSMRGSKILSGGSRTLNLSIDKYKKFYNTDVLNALDTYIERGSSKITYAQLFGYGGEKVEEMLKQIAKEAEAAGRPIRDDEVQAIAKILQNIQGLRKLPSKPLNVAQESIATLMRVTLLHMATLSSLGEAFIPFTKARFRDSLGGMLAATSALPKHYFGKVLRNTPEARAYEAAQAVGLATDVAASTRLNNILGGGEIMTGLNQKINNANFVINLLSEWVKFVQVSAFHTGRLKIINNLKAIEKAGPDSISALHRAKELRELGVSVDQGLAWLKRGASQQDPFYRSVQRGALRFTDDTVIHPDATVKPGIQNSPEALLLTQLKAYPVAFANVILRDWGEGIFRPWANIGQDLLAGDLTTQTFKAEAYSSASKAVRVATGAALMYAATEAGLQLKDIIKWGPDGNPEQPQPTGVERVLKVLDTSGMMGHAATAYHIFNGNKFNQDPFYALVGPAPGMAAKIAGPAAGELGEFLGFGDAEEGALQDALAKEVANLTRMPLPIEILWSMASPNGTEAWRRDFRKWLSSPEIAPEDFDPYQTLPHMTKPINYTGWHPLNLVRDWFYPDKTLEELLELQEAEREEELLLEDFKSSEDTPQEKADRMRELLKQKHREGKISSEPKNKVMGEEDGGSE